MSCEAYLIKETNVEFSDDEMIIKKTVSRTSSFTLRCDKILELFNCEQKLDENLTGELTMDKNTWSDILNSLNPSDYSSDELEMIDNIRNDVIDREVVCYYCF